MLVFPTLFINGKLLQILKVFGKKFPLKNLIHFARIVLKCKILESIMHIVKSLKRYSAFNKKEVSKKERGREMKL